MGIIETLTRGFQNVHRRPWLLLIPVLLDILLWIGPQASIARLMEAPLQELEASVVAAGATEEEGEDLLGGVRQLARQVIPGYNALSSLRVGTLGVPSLTTWGGARLGTPSAFEVIWVAFLLVLDMPDLLVSVPDLTTVGSPVWQIPSGIVWLLLVLVLSGVGILVGSAYVTGIAAPMGEEEAFLPRALWLSARFAIFWVLRIALVLAVGVPVLVVVSLLGALSPGLASLFGTVVLGLVTWGSFYGVFLTASLTINRVSVWRAVWNSFNVVLRNFWPTVGLFVLINLIGGGLTILWQQLSHGSWLTLLGILGNAYVGTGLVTASMLYYHDRYTQWQELMAELLRRSKRLA